LDADALDLYRRMTADLALVCALGGASGDARAAQRLEEALTAPPARRTDAWRRASLAIRDVVNSRYADADVSIDACAPYARALDRLQTFLLENADLLDPRFPIAAA
jgi:hypothetical protein